MKISVRLSSIFENFYISIITSKRNKLESPGWSGFVSNSKPDLIHLEVITMAKKEKLQNICTHITFKRIELEGPCWSGFVRF